MKPPCFAGHENYRKQFSFVFWRGVLFDNVPNFGCISDDGRWKKMAASQKYRIVKRG